LELQHLVKAILEVISPRLNSEDHGIFINLLESTFNKVTLENITKEFHSHPIHNALEKASKEYGCSLKKLTQLYHNLNLSRCSGIHDVSNSKAFCIISALAKAINE